MKISKMVYVWLLLIVLLISTSLMATDYIVSGAGNEISES